MHVCLCVDDIGLVNNCRIVLHYTCTYVLSAVCQVFANICSLQQFVLYITSDLPSPYSHVCSCMSTGTGEPPSLVHYMSHCHITLLVPECLYFQMCVCMLLCACMFAFCAQESTCQALRSMCMHANTVSTLISQFDSPIERTVCACILIPECLQAQSSFLGSVQVGLVSLVTNSLDELNAPRS